MSEPNSLPKKYQINDPTSVIDLILEYIIDNGWKDYKKFARRLTDCIIDKQASSKQQLTELLNKMNHPFFDFNEITKDQFLASFPLNDMLEHCKISILPIQKKVVHKHSNRKTISKKIRILILERDGYKCRLCGKTGAETKLEVDHRIPVAKGGTDSLDNLWTLCIDCNRGKSDLSLIS
jgi:hypothetical protein